MFVVLYRWQIKEGMELQFTEAWAEITDYILKNFDSLGSRLHKSEDGFFYGYAQWRSAAQREQAFAAMAKINNLPKLSVMIEESLPEIVLEPVADYLVLPEKNKSSFSTCMIHNKNVY